MTTSTRVLLTDPANLITQAGLVLGTVGIYAALNREFEVAILFLLAAFAADMLFAAAGSGPGNRSRRARGAS